MLRGGVLAMLIVVVLIVMVLLIIVLVTIQILETAAEPAGSRPTCSTGARPVGRPGWPPPSVTDGQQRSG